MPKIVYDNFQVLPAVLKDDIMTFEVITTDGDAQKLDTVPSNYQEADDAAKENWFSKLGWYIVEYHSGPAPELDLVTAKGFKYDPFECQLADFPAGYKLFAHINSTRNDVYLYGSTVQRNFRSPAEFHPHLFWLMSGKPENGCGCRYCSKTSQKAINAKYPPPPVEKPAAKPEATSSAPASAPVRQPRAAQGERVTYATRNGLMRTTTTKK